MATPREILQRQRQDKVMSQQRTVTPREMANRNRNGGITRVPKAKPTQVASAGPDYSGIPNPTGQMRPPSPTAGNYEDYAQMYGGQTATGRHTTEGPRIIRRPGQSPILTNMTGEPLDAAIQGAAEGVPWTKGDMTGGVTYRAPGGGSRTYADVGAGAPLDVQGEGSRGIARRPVSGGMREGGVYDFGRRASGGSFGSMIAAAARGRAEKTSADQGLKRRALNIEQERATTARKRLGIDREDKAAINEERMASAALKRKQASIILSPEKEMQLKERMSKDKNIAGMFKMLDNADLTDQDRENIYRDIDAYKQNLMLTMTDPGAEESGSLWWKEEAREPTYEYLPREQAAARRVPQSRRIGK